MQDKFYIPKDIFDELISHCKDAFPNEACGILAGIENKASKIYKMTNIEKSPVSYFMDSKEQFKVMKDIRENNLEMVAIFHSHPSSPAYPSNKDLNLAFYEDSIYIIVSLIEKEPVVKGYSMREGKIEEVGITVKG
ncbi:MAG: M67 family metallopeptidase [Thermodesulfovibrionales bacterium]|nr:M67 family metallopeptidase [Thermodesulfovibrionales bacterium]MDP3110792.1 M67 family metallopeptidase [Thermodesulfovibrionales bacterium]